MHVCLNARQQHCLLYYLAEVSLELAMHKIKL